MLKTAPHNADGSLLSDEEYGRQRMGLLKEKSALEELLQDTGQGVNKWLDLSEKTFDFALTARDRFAKGDCETKREIFTALGSNLFLKNKRLSIQALKPFLIIETAFHGGERPNEPIEPKNNGSTHGQIVKVTSHCPNMSACPDDVRTYKDRAERAASLIYAHFMKEFGTLSKR
jgi:hypothetical protein